MLAVGSFDHEFYRLVPEVPSRERSGWHQMPWSSPWSTFSRMGLGEGLGRHSQNVVLWQSTAAFASGPRRSQRGQSAVLVLDVRVGRRAGNRRTARRAACGNRRLSAANVHNPVIRARRNPIAAQRHTRNQAGKFAYLPSGMAIWCDAGDEYADSRNVSHAPRSPATAAPCVPSAQASAIRGRGASGLSSGQAG